MRWLYNDWFLLLFFMAVIKPVGHVHSLATAGSYFANGSEWTLLGSCCWFSWLSSNLNGRALGFHATHDLGFELGCIFCWLQSLPCFFLIFVQPPKIGFI
jgi:hypothetical protein